MASRGRKQPRHRVRRGTDGADREQVEASGAERKSSASEQQSAPSPKSSGAGSRGDTPWKTTRNGLIQSAVADSVMLTEIGSVEMTTMAYVSGSLACRHGMQRVVPPHWIAFSEDWLLGYDKEKKCARS